MTTIVTDQFSAEDSDAGELLDFEAAKDSSSWERADPFEALIKPISGMGYQVKMPDAEGGHTVAIGEQRGRYVGLCTCKGFKFHDSPCTHLCTIRKADFIGATDAYGDPVRIAKIILAIKLNVFAIPLSWTPAL